MELTYKEMIEEAVEKANVFDLLFDLDLIPPNTKALYFKDNDNKVHRIKLKKDHTQVKEQSDEN